MGSQQSSLRGVPGSSSILLDSMCCGPIVNFSSCSWFNPHLVCGLLTGLQNNDTSGRRPSPDGDGRLILSSSADETIRLWDTSVVQVLLLHSLPFFPPLFLLYSLSILLLPLDPHPSSLCLIIAHSVWANMTVEGLAWDLPGV